MSKTRPTTRQEALETPESLGGEYETPDKGGRSGGTLARKVGTRDEEKRAFDRPAGATRVRKSDEEED